MKCSRCPSDEARWYRDRGMDTPKVKRILRLCLDCVVMEIQKSEAESVHIEGIESRSTASSEES